MTSIDIVIVGGGIAGASLGAMLAADARVLILEMEDQPGYHATGRSVAFWEETYGGPVVQPLTTASGPFLSNPDPDFTDAPILSPRGTLHVGRAADAGHRDALLAQFAGKVDLRPVDPAAFVAGLRPEWTIGIYEEGCRDIDVATLHQAWLRCFRRAGGRLETGARLVAASRAAGGWRLDTTIGPVTCGVIVNAAGAWADEVACACGVPAIGFTPLRRTVAQLHVPTLPASDLPLVMDLAGSFYFKPGAAGRLWLTPHDEEPSPPCDAAPEELAVAIAIDRFQSAVDWPIASIERRWAGLRTFSPDRAPVFGFDPGDPGFFWFAGQGGFGIQTSPAAAWLAASLITGGAPAPAIAHIATDAYSPERFR